MHAKTNHAMPAYPASTLRSITLHHNQTMIGKTVLTNVQRPTRVLTSNHNQTLVNKLSTNKPSTSRRTLTANHNQTLVATS